MGKIDLSEFEYLPDDKEAAEEMIDDLVAELAHMDAKDVVKLAFYTGYDAGANDVQVEWDLAEDLRVESEAGWDW